MRDDEPKNITPPVAPDVSPATEEIARVEPHPATEASAPLNLPELTPSTSGTASPAPHNHPFFLRMMQDATAYVRMEEERDHLRLKMDETAREHQAALKRVQELEEQLKSQSENAALKARQAKESEDLQTARLRAIADVIEGALDMEPAPEGATDESLESAVGAFDRLCAQAKDRLNQSKSKGALAAVYRSIFPEGEIPSSTEELTQLFGPGSSTLADFVRAQTHGTAAVPTNLPSTTAPSQPPKRSRNDQKVMDWMKDRIVKLEADLTAAQEELNGLKSNPPSTEREEFLLTELKNVNHQLECVCFNQSKEEVRVRDRLDSYVSSAQYSTHPFWSDRARGQVLATLLDRSWHTAIVLEACRRTLARVHHSLFPMNEQPEGLFELLKRFRQGKAIKKFVREQLIGGANVALGWVRSHYPNFDFLKISAGPPPVPSGGPVPMLEHYQATREDALVIIHRVLKEEKNWVEPKEEPAE